MKMIRPLSNSHFFAPNRTQTKIPFTITLIKRHRIHFPFNFRTSFPINNGKSLVYKVDFSKASQKACLVCEKYEKATLDGGGNQHPCTVLGVQSQL